MDVSELDYKQVLGYVSKQRIDKSHRYIYQKDKNLCVGVELLLNHLLNKMGIDDPIFDTDGYGKPYLKNYSDVYFNLSHSENYVACAVSDSPVGVDIEYVHDIDWDLARHCYHDCEYEYILNNSNSKKAFYEMWVLKESYMKMTGLGFRLPLNEFTVEITNEIKVIEENGNKFGLWNLGEHILGVCSQTPITEPVLISLHDI